MRGEILGLERRRFWRDEDKLEIVTSVGIGRATVTQIAQRHEITRQQIYAWRHELKMKGLWSPDTGALFFPLDIPAVAEVPVPQPPVSKTPPPAAVELRLRGGGGMMGPGTGVRVYLACGVTDMRKGIAGLAALAQDVLHQKPTSGAVFAFRGRRGDRTKLLYWDGQGFCLYYKVLERERFPWPRARDGAVRLTSAQLAMLWEGIDWRRPDWGAPPARAG